MNQTCALKAQTSTVIDSLAWSQKIRNGAVKAYAFGDKDASVRTRTRGRVVRQPDIHFAVIVSATTQGCVAKIGMLYEYEV